MGLPTGLGEMWDALRVCTDALKRAITLVFTRQLLDPTSPKIAGHDPRTVLSPSLEWSLIATAPDAGARLDAFVEHLNASFGEPVLTGGWEEMIPEDLARALAGVSSWSPSVYLTGGDMLGDLIARVRGERAGSFFTPYNVSYSHALALEIGPDDRVCDPACGSGRMLLAALQICRERHRGAAPERLAGIDLDPDAAKVCRLNLMLAGFGWTRGPAEHGR